MSAKTPAAPGQYLGYTLQTVRMCYYLASCHPNQSVALEVFEDVGVIEDGGVVLAEQTKSALTHNPVSDWAIDLWKTFSNWADAIKNGVIENADTVFRLYSAQEHVGTVVRSFSQANKEMLNGLSGLSNQGFDPVSDSGFKSRAGFRDLMAFTFQPQNIVANPDVLFYGSDTTAHREKLKTIFSYVLGTTTAEMLSAEWELASLNKEYRRKKSEHKALTDASARWRNEVKMRNGQMHVFA